MKLKAVVMDEKEMDLTIKRIAHEILEKLGGARDAVLVGIQRRGVYLSHKIRDVLKSSGYGEIPCGELDITFYRDDLSMMADHPMVHSTSIPFDITGKDVVLVDDVLFTGRTVRAALDALMDMGRPRRVLLAVLVDRGHRELPIHPDVVGRVVPTSRDELVEVYVKELDGRDGIAIVAKE